MNEYFGYFWKTPLFNVDGYNASQFIYLYLIGGYMKRFVSRDWIDKHRCGFIITYILCSVLYAGFVCLDGVHRVPHWDPWKYNNPLLIVSSMSFFLFFASFHFKSRCINAVAASTFAIFLVQCSVKNLFGLIGNLYFAAVDVIGLDNVVVKMVYSLIAGLIFSVAVMLFDQLRILLFKPIWKVYDVIERKVKRCFSK